MSRARAYDNDAPTGMVIVLTAVSMVASILLFATPRPLGPIPLPLLPVMTVYFWTIVRPGLMPTALVFLAGLVLDLLTATPLGFWALSLLAASGAARLLRPRVLGADIWLRLLGVAGAVAAAVVAALVGFGAAGRPVQAGWLQLLQILLTLLTYPLLESGLFALGKSAGLTRGRA